MRHLFFLQFTIASNGHTFNFLVANGFSACSGLGHAGCQWLPALPIVRLTSKAFVGLCMPQESSSIGLGAMAYLIAGEESCGRAQCPLHNRHCARGKSMHISESKTFVSNAAAFLTVADDAFGRAVPFAFLERVRDEWMQGFAEKGRTAGAHSMDRTFGCVSDFVHA